MKRKVYDKKPSSLIFYSQGSYFVILDVKPEYAEEKKFKNSAFIKTGRSVPTGKYTGYELKFYTGTAVLTFIDMQNKIIDVISNYVSKTILNGFTWNGYKVWLSTENQQNYTSWLNAARSNAEIFPMTAKFNVGFTNETVYYDFSTVEELEDFYSKMVKHINDTVNFGRKMKDCFKDNLTLYKESLS